MQQCHDFLAGSVGKAHVLPDKSVFLREALATNGANVPPAVQQPQRFPPQLQIAYLPNAVIVNAFRIRAAAPADVNTVHQ